MQQSLKESVIIIFFPGACFVLKQSAVHYTQDMSSVEHTLQGRGLDCMYLLKAI
jgi:hypothetical protein